VLKKEGQQELSFENKKYQSQIKKFDCSTKDKNHIFIKSEQFTNIDAEKENINSQKLVATSKAIAKHSSERQ